MTAVKPLPVTTYGCVEQGWMDRLKRVRPIHDCTVTTIWGPKLRHIARAETTHGPMWADRVTGQLYRNDGTCLSSPRLRLQCPAEHARPD